MHAPAAAAPSSASSSSSSSSQDTAALAPRTPKSRRKSGLSVTTGPSPAGALFQSLSNVAVCLNSVRDYDFPQRSVTPETVCLSPAAKSLFGSVVTSAGTSA